MSWPLMNGRKFIREIRDGWFTETETLWPGQKFSLALDGFSNESILYHEHSGIQDILVFKSAQYGNVLVLDGVIQLSERDEFAYHEMMVHVPLCAHERPSRVLIVGGGDLGVLREVCKHDCVQEIVLVEIDAQVVQVACTYFGASTALKDCIHDTRLRVVHQDAATFLQQDENFNYFDIILGDTSDPVGPAETLFQPAFYEHMYKAVREQGIVCMQAECFWIHLDLIGDMHACCRDIFDTAEYATTMVPTYPCGQIGFILARKCESSRHNRLCSRPVRRPSLPSMQWYSPEMHKAAFVLPPFVKRRLSENDEMATGTRNGYLSSGEDRPDACCFLDGLMQFVRKVGIHCKQSAILVAPDEPVDSR